MLHPRIHLTLQMVVYHVNFMDHIINFDLIDIVTGLFAFSQHNKSLDKDPTLSGYGYQHIQFGRCEITGDIIKPLISA